MCGILCTWWLGRQNNGPIEERTNVGVRGSAVNTRLVKLLPLNEDKLVTGIGSGKEENRGAHVEANGGTDSTGK